MKKFLSIILALVTMFCIGTTAFAYENVDNTFDNFTPGPGVQAPDNWYDPYSYDTEGLITNTALPGASSNAAYYCKTAKKLWQWQYQCVNDVCFYPYKTMIKLNEPYEIGGKLVTHEEADYCPYCGVVSLTSDASAYNIEFKNTHEYVGSVVYGAYCPEGKGFSAAYSMDIKMEWNSCYACSSPHQYTKYYRFVSEKDLNSEYAHLFSETAHLYGDGVDGKIEDLETDRIGRFVGWNNHNEEPAELTFWEKIVQFFVSIGDFFVKLFTWSW